MPYGTIFTTTAGKLNTEKGRYAYSIYNKAMRWTELLYDLPNEVELDEVVSKNCAGNIKVVLLEFNHRQLGYTDKWLKDRMAAALAEGEDAECDYLNKWIAGNTSSPITKQMLEIIKQSEVKNPRIEITDYGYAIRWMVDEQTLAEKINNNYFIIGLDTSDAVGNDDIAMTIRDVVTGEVLGAGTYNETNLATFADFIVSILERFPNSILIPERRSSAVVIIDYILRLMVNKGMNPFKRIFNWVYDEIDKFKNKYPEITSNKLHNMDAVDSLRKYFGFATSGSGKTSRSLLYGNILSSSVKYTADKVRDKILIDQLSNLTVRNGRIDHSATGKDDMVISWLLGFWFLTTANNKHLYGIDSNKVLQDVVNNELINNLSKEEITKVKEQESIRKKIETLFDLLRNEKNEFVAMKIINRIKDLESKIDTKIIKNFNIDAMLDEIKIMKRIKKYKNAA